MNQGAPRPGATRSAETSDRDDSGGGQPAAEETAAEAREEGREAADNAREEGREVAETARGEGRDVAEAARGEGRELARATRAQAAAVTDEAAAQARGVADDALAQLHEQARLQTNRMAGSLHTAGDQLRALADGRPEEAGPMDEYARRAAQQLGRAGDRVDELGFDGIVEELEVFARRRPTAFLLSAVASGFLIGRVARNRGQADGR